MKYPFRMDLSDPAGGNRHRVIRKQERLPVKYSQRLKLRSADMWGVAARSGEPYSGRRYWARYENAQGKTWETSNPWDRSADLRISRIRFGRVRDYLDQRQRRKVEQGFAGWVESFGAELEALEEEHSITQDAYGNEVKPN